MSLFIFMIVVIILVALVLWAIQYIPNLPPMPKGLICALAILIGAYLIAQKAGIVA